MILLDSQTALEKSPAATKPKRRTARWYLAVAVGSAAAAALGFVLSYLASLPFMIGLFFFALLGLLIGAVTFRVASPAAPIERRRLVAGTAVIVAIGWNVSIAVEARDFPHSKAGEALLKIAILPEGMTATQARADVTEFVRRTLREQYGGDGVVGYVRWVLASSVMEYRIETIKRPILLRPSQHRGWWAARGALSAVLLSFGVYSQVAPLTGAAKAGDPSGGDHRR